MGTSAPPRDPSADRSAPRNGAISFTPLRARALHLGPLRPGKGPGIAGDTSMAARKSKQPEATSAEARAFTIVLEDIRAQNKAFGEGQELLRESQELLRESQERLCEGQERLREGQEQLREGQERLR